MFQNYQNVQKFQDEWFYYHPRFPLSPKDEASAASDKPPWRLNGFPGHRR
jgi:hypothetical protein